MPWLIQHLLMPLRACKPQCCKTLRRNFKNKNKSREPYMEPEGQGGELPVFPESFPDTPSPELVPLVAGIGPPKKGLGADLLHHPCTSTSQAQNMRAHQGSAHAMQRKVCFSWHSPVCGGCLNYRRQTCLAASDKLLLQTPNDTLLQRAWLCSRPADTLNPKP